jgi:hypothetical protein
MNTITNRIDAIAAQATAFNEKKIGYEKNSRKLTWTIVADVYALGLLAFEPENARDFDHELTARGLRPAKNGENPWLKVINVAVGEQYLKSNGKRAWKPNASFSKYARALRYMEGQKVTAEDALAYIKNDRSYTDAKGAQAKHLIGMIAADKLVNPAVERDMTDAAAVARAVGKPLGSIPLPTDTRKGRHFTRAFGYVENGVFVLLGQLRNTDKAAKLDASKAGKEVQ